MKKLESKVKNIRREMTNNRIRWCGHVLIANEERIPEKVLSMEVKGDHPGGRPKLEWSQHIGKDVTQKKKGRM
jgi:hypothetical protein